MFSLQFPLVELSSALASATFGGVSAPPSDVSFNSSCQGGPGFNICSSTSGSADHSHASASTSDVFSTPPSDVSFHSSYQGGLGSGLRGCCHFSATSESDLSGVIYFQKLDIYLFKIQNNLLLLLIKCLFRVVRGFCVGCCRHPLLLPSIICSLPW